MGLALFCDEVDEKNWWHFYFYLNAQLLPVEEIDMTIFRKIVPAYSTWARISSLISKMDVLLGNNHPGTNSFHLNSKQ